MAVLYVRKSGNWVGAGVRALTDLDTTVTGAELDAIKSKVDGIEENADVTDATNVAAAGAFMKSSDDLDDISEGTTNKHFTSALASKLDGIEEGADVTDATNVAAAGAFIKTSDDLDDITEGATNKHFTSSEKTKLSGIEEGAQVNTVTPSNTVTFTGKRVTKRVVSVSSNATPTLNTDDCDAFTMTLSTTITNFSTNLSGTPTDFQQLLGRITASGGDRGITLGSSWTDVGGDFPDTIPSGKTLTFGAIYNSGTSKWDVLAWKLEA